MQVNFPQIGKSSRRQGTSPIYPPIGGFYTLQNLQLTEPSRAFVDNLYIASNRAERTVPEDAMTPDVHSCFWSM